MGRKKWTLKNVEELIKERRSEITRRNEADRIERQTRFMARVKELFPDKRWSFEKLFYFDCYTPVIITCHEIGFDGKEHGDFIVIPHYLLGKTCPGCIKCAREAKIRRKGKETLAEIQRIHKDKDWSYEKFVYLGCNKKSTVTCHKKGKDVKEHGDFQVTPNDLLNRHGCKKCWVDSLTKDGDEFIRQAKEVHGEDTYDYSKTVYDKDESNVGITCPIHGPFSLRARHHLEGQGCPYCKESNLERETRMLLLKLNVAYKQWEHFKWLGKQSIDFYLADYNIAIECQGIQHFEPVDFAGRGKEWAQDELNKALQRDQRKARLCEEHGLPLYYIRYDENVEEALLRILSDAKKNASC